MKQVYQMMYEIGGIGRVIYIEALEGLINGKYKSPTDFPDWLKRAQTELAEWLREKPKRKAQYFLNMARLKSYELRPHAREMDWVDSDKSKESE